MPLPDFIEERFPVDISYGSSGGPRFNTTITTTDSGAEQRVSHWSEALREYEASTGLQALEDEDQQNGLSRLIEFFNVVRGRAIAFRWKDWSDFSTSLDMISEPTPFDQVLEAINAERTQFQLRRAYRAGISTASWRIIRKPVQGTVRVAFDEIEQLGNFSVNHSNGIITFFSPVPIDKAVSAGCEYDVPCRFGSDTLSMRLDEYRSASAQIPVREIRI